MLDTINISIKKRQAFELQYWKGTFLLTSVLGPVSVNYMSKMLCHLLPDGLALIFKRLVQKLVGKDACLCKIGEASRFVHLIKW